MPSCKTPKATSSASSSDKAPVCPDRQEIEPVLRPPAAPVSVASGLRTDYLLSIGTSQFRAELPGPDVLTDMRCPSNPAVTRANLTGTASLETRHLMSVGTAVPFAVRVVAARGDLWLLASGGDVWWRMAVGGGY